jgi:hypothetical protein
MSKLPRVAAIVLPILKTASLTGVYGTIGDNVFTWVPDVDYRRWPMVEVRRLGGTRNSKAPKLHSLPVIELTVYTKTPEGGLPETEQLYEDALEALYDAVEKQTATEFGYLSSIKETMGSTQFSSPYQDSWRVQGLIQLGIRPPRSA